MKIRGEASTEKLIKLGMEVGENFNRLHGVILDPSHCWLIKIGNNVTMAPGVHVLAHDASTKMILGYTKIGTVKIGDYVFIGANSVILPNVDIGSNVIIGANSTVTKNLPNNGVYAGNPAKFICSMEDYIDKQNKLFITSSKFDSDYTLKGKITIEKKKIMLKELEKGECFVK